jgi:hypothetical protein
MKMIASIHVSFLHVVMVFGGEIRAEQNHVMTEILIIQILA